MTNQIARSFGLMVVVGVCLLHSAQCTAADKHDRVIGLYDVIVHFQDPNINWQQISDAFVQQFLVDTSSNVCIRPALLPARFLGNTQPQTHVGLEGTAGLDYVAFGDLYKDPDGYRMEAYLVTGKSREVVLQHIQPKFTDPKDAPFQAWMAALNLRTVGSGAGSGTRPLADMILDFEKKQREEYPHDHAIAPELKVNLADSDRYPLKLSPGEKRDISFTLMDCDGVADKGAEVPVETITGDVTPVPVKVDGDGKGKFTYTAPRKDADGLIHVAFIYLRGSEHPGIPEVDNIDVHIAAPNLCFSVAVDLKMQMPDTPQIYENHHVETIYKVVGFDEKTGCPFTSLKPGETWGLVEASIRGTATGHRETGTSASSSIDRPGDLTVASARFVREAQGGTFTFVIRQVPAGDAEEYVGNCAAQRWEPWPYQFKLSEEELDHPDKLQKSLALNLPLGENSCTGTGTAVLTGHP
ncbi:MAG: hypothetical protein ABR865_16410 [Terracidiphilus sp.]